MTGTTQSSSPRPLGALCHRGASDPCFLPSHCDTASFLEQVKVLTKRRFHQTLLQPLRRPCVREELCDLSLQILLGRVEA